jgi:hypothetical protein
MSDFCSYKLATDGCNSNPPSYLAILNDETISHKSHKQNWINSIDIIMDSKKYTIDTEFKINDMPHTGDLPYVTSEIRVSRKEKFIVFEARLFTLQFDGEQNLKFNECGPQVCGLCSAADTIDFESNRYKCSASGAH